MSVAKPVRRLAGSLRALVHVVRNMLPGPSADSVRRLVRFLRDARQYRRLPYAEPLFLRDAMPQLGDWTDATPFDPHYLYQGVWASRRVAAREVDHHVDVGSQIEYVTALTLVTDVTFVDIRPLEARVERLDAARGSVLALPFEDRSVESLSCLHVAEHIGLGRYGDPLDPAGTRKAAAELERVLAPGGQLLFSLPVGRPRTCFNAHRIHAPADVVGMFPELELEEFSAVDDLGQFRPDANLEELRSANYGCGLFAFTRRN
jgi:SAM-dependent methyltransferase